MEVTLIRPPVYSVGLMGAQVVPFLGISYIGAAAKKAGHSVDIIDMCGEDITRTEILRNKYVAHGMPFSALKERIKNSDIIGFTCMFSQDWIFHRELIQYVRKLFPQSTLVAGGEHISSLPQYCLDDCPELNMCVIGEGEDIFVNLLAALEKDNNLSDVQGLVYRSPQKQEYCQTPRASRIRNVDDLPLPAWDMTPLENYLSRGLTYHIKRGRTIPMLATRGCPYSCTFCSNPHMWTNFWVARDARLIVDEMQYYIDHYKADNFVFSDLTAVIDKKNIIALCNEIIKRNIQITWQLPTLRTEAVDDHVLQLMYQAGCRELDFAIESGSKKTLASVKKRNDPDKIYSLVKNALKRGMNLSSNIIIGLPQEGYREFFQTYWLTVKLALSGLQEINVFPFVPYPGSKLFNDFLQEKKIKLNDDYFLNLYGYADLSKSFSWSPHFGPKTLNLMRLTLFINFYTLMFLSRPKRIIQLIINAAKGTTTTKLEGVVKRVFKNIEISRYRKVQHAK